MGLPSVEGVGEPRRITGDDGVEDALMLRAGGAEREIGDVRDQTHHGIHSTPVCRPSCGISGL